MRSVKESSGDVNPPVIETRAFAAGPSRRRTLVDYFALAVATCGVGYLPVAPGTWGSAVGVGIYLLFRSASAPAFAYAALKGWNVAALESARSAFVLLALLALTLAGTWAATRAEKLLARKDPAAVVVDEVAGQLITFLAVPFNAGSWAIVAGFLAFRAFDIWKPYPIRRLEALESGLGIMADDVLAGAYAATLMSLIMMYRFL